MHSIHVNSAALVRAVVPTLIEEGYAFVRLDQMPEFCQYETSTEDYLGMERAKSPPAPGAARRGEMNCNLDGNFLALNGAPPGKAIRLTREAC